MNEDLIREFLLENFENLDRLDRELVELEEDPRNAEILGSVFRAVHTIKGTCGFVAFARLEAVAHVGESLLARMRDGELLLNTEIATALLALSDAIREMLGLIETTGQEGATDYSALVATLKRLTASGVTAAAPDIGANSRTPVAATGDGGGPVRGRPVQAGGAATNLSKPAVSDSSLRIDVAVLDRLVELVDDLVLARNQIVACTAAGNDGAFSGALERLNLVTSELQESVSQTRRQPIDHIWNKLPRLVRDLAVQCGKSVRLEMEGNEIVLDRTIIEAIKDPLMHIVRNSVDHGIEPPRLRVERGKPPEGVIRLSARQEGGQTTIEITDDGAGADPASIRAKAQQRGLITAEQAGRTSDDDVLRFTFLPGFSTSEKVSNISGRGVGLDVVRTNIGKIGGTVAMTSRAGVGTTLTMAFPSAVATVPAPAAASGPPTRLAPADRPVPAERRLDAARGLAIVVNAAKDPTSRAAGDLPDRRAAGS